MVGNPFFQDSTIRNFIKDVTLRLDEVPEKLFGEQLYVGTVAECNTFPPLFHRDSCREKC